MTKPVSSLSVTHYSLWKRTIDAALNEPYLNKLLERVHAAELAIFNRVQELAQNPDGVSMRPNVGLFLMPARLWGF
jgi:hypothetical protein